MPPLSSLYVSPVLLAFGLPGIIITCFCFTIIWAIRRHRSHASQINTTIPSYGGTYKSQETFDMFTASESITSIDEPWREFTSVAFEEPLPMSQTRPMNSGDMVRMLSLPSPSIRRHSYPSNKETVSNQPEHKLQQSRIGSVKTRDGFDIHKKDLVMERGGWRRHAKVFGSNLPGDRKDSL